MATRVVIGGQTAWDNAEYRELAARPSARLAVPDRKSRIHAPEPVDCASAIPPDDPQSPFRVGRSFFDQDEEIGYRVVKTADWSAGWAPLTFWRNRWGLYREEVLRLARIGLLDSCMEESSQVRRYRCRDENQILKHPIVTQAALRTRMRIVTEASVAVRRKKPQPPRSKLRT